MMTKVEERLAQGLENFDFDQFEGTKFIYLSHSEENNAQKWKGWKSANERAYRVLNTIPKNSNVQVLVEQFPNEDHMSNFATSVTSAMRTYFTTILPKQHAEFSDDAYSITIRAKVPNENDGLFITGNQESLGNWKSDQVKMMQVSPLIREITLSLRDHAAVTFYLNGTSQAWIKYGDGGQSTHPMMFRPKEGDEYSFEVVRYND